MHKTKEKADSILTRLPQFSSVALETIPSLVVALDTEGYILYFNHACRKTTGFEAEEVIGKPIWELLILPEERESVREVFRNILSGRFPNHYENYWLTKSGDRRWIAWSNTAIQGDGGAVECIIGTGSDITEHKVVEEQMRAAIKKLRDIQFALDESAIVAVTDAQGIITYANDKFCEISKYSREELLGQDHRIVNSRYHPKDYFRNLWKTIASGKVWRGEIRNRAKDGSIYWVQTTIVPFLDQMGKPYQYVAIRSEITGRKKAEQRLAIEHSVTRAVSQSTSTSESFRQILSSFCHYLGGTLAELFLVDHKSGLLRCAEIWTSSGDARGFLELSSKITFAKGEGLPGRIWLTGSPLWISSLSRDQDVFRRRNDALEAGLGGVFGFPVIFNGEVIGVVDIFTSEDYYHDQDLVSMFAAVGNQIGQFVARKRMEEDLERHARQLEQFQEKIRYTDKLATLGIMASEVAHEVGTPLNIISGRVELLAQREKLNPQISRDLAIINQQIERISKIIRRGLDLTRREQGQFRKIHVRGMLMELIEFMRHRMDRAGIDVELTAEDDLEILGDPDQLQQVCLNILMNAVQAISGKGKIAIRSSVIFNGEDSFVRIQIEDSGKGIPAEDVDKIFDPFFSTKRESGGTGLGLAVVRDILKRHGGEVEVELPEKGGATFSVLLPLPR